MTVIARIQIAEKILAEMILTSSDNSESEISVGLVSNQSSRPQTPLENNESGLFCLFFAFVGIKTQYIIIIAALK